MSKKTTTGKEEDVSTIEEVALEVGVQEARMIQTLLKQQVGMVMVIMKEGHHMVVIVIKMRDSKEKTNAAIPGVIDREVVKAAI